MAFLLVDEKGNQQVKKKDKGAEKVNFLDENINKIINADCLDIFKQLPDKCIDLVLTDPPYGIGNKFTSEYGLQERKSKRGSFSWNDKIPEKEVFDEIIRVSKIKSYSAAIISRNI